MSSYSTYSAVVVAIRRSSVPVARVDHEVGGRETNDRESGGGGKELHLEVGIR